jgi:ApaG protein
VLVPAKVDENLSERQGEAHKEAACTSTLKEGAGPAAARFPVMKLAKALYRAFIRANKKFVGNSGLHLQLTPSPRQEMQRFISFDISVLDKAVLLTLLGDWPRSIHAVRDEQYLTSKRKLSREELRSLVRRCFRDGDAATCLDFALEALKSLQEIVALNEQTSDTTTNGVRVLVTTLYSAQDQDTSRASQGYPYFYRVQIENRSNSTVQLLGRHWRFSAQGFEDIVVPKFATGVIGEQPVLAPQQGFKYMSSTVIHRKEGGTMSGSFEFQTCDEKAQRFEVIVGETKLLPRSFD